MGHSIIINTLVPSELLSNGSIVHSVKLIENVSVIINLNNTKHNCNLFNFPSAALPEGVDQI